MTAKEILVLVEEEDVEFIRLQFTDMFGTLKNIAVTAKQLPHVLEHHYSIDSFALYGEDNDSDEDFYLNPDLDTFVLLPWRPQQGKVARLLCDIYDENGDIWEGSPRTILKRVLTKAKEKGYEFLIKPECQFFLFHSDEDGMPTTITHEKAGYFDVGPTDLGENARRDMVMTLEEMGFEIEASYHEKAPAQHGVDFKAGEPLAIADSIITFRNAVRSIARRFGLYASFMPKPKKDVAGSSMYLNFSVYKNRTSIFELEDEELCKEGMYFIGGMLEHTNALCAITNPLVNSYKRICASRELLTQMTWGIKKKNTMLSLEKKAGEDASITFRLPDSAANPYVALALCIAAGMDGLEKQKEPITISHSMDAKNCRANQLPQTLNEAIEELQQDTLVKEVLGEPFFLSYYKEKQKEWKEYMEEITDWEIQKYLNQA